MSGDGAGGGADGGDGGAGGAVKGGTKPKLPPPPPYTSPEWLKKTPGLALKQAQWGQKAVGKLADGTAKRMPGELTKAAAKYGIRSVPIIGNTLSAVAAIDDFKHGNWVGGTLHAIGAVPGPIGWVGGLTGMAWDATHHGGGGSACGLWDAPDGVKTFMLPAAAAEQGKVADADKALTEAQRKVFGFQDGPSGTVWNENPPEALRLDTAEVRGAVDNWLKGVADTFNQLDHTMQASGEPYLLKARSQLQAHFAAMAKLPAQSAAIMAELKAASDAAEKGYESVTQTNGNIRRQLTGGGSISDTAPAHALDGAMKSLTTQSKTANEKLSGLFSHSPVPPLAPGGATLAGNRKPAVPMPKVEKTPMPAMPTVPAAPPSAKTPEKSDLDKLLSQLGKQATPAMPQMPHMGGAPMGGSPLGHGGGGSPLSGGTPLGQQGRKLDTDSDRKKLVDDDEKAEKKAKLSGAGDAKQEKAAPVPGAAAAGPAAAAAGKNGAKPAAAELKPTEVDVKGHKAVFPDPRTARLASLLAAADPAHPLPLSDAAAQAGLVPPTPGQDPGRQVSPADSRPGDILVAGDKRFVMLGDARFFDVDSYTVVSADQLPKDLGSRAGYFHLLDPAAGGSSTGPVSGQAPANVAYPVPGGTASTGVPADASPSGVTSAGTPGVPAQGNGGGPASAAATDTGLKEPVPSATPQRLDPKTVK